LVEDTGTLLPRSVVDQLPLLFFLVAAGLGTVVFLGFRAFRGRADRRTSEPATELVEGLLPPAMPVFVSYARTDANRVQGVLAQLRERGVDPKSIFLDAEAIGPGEHFPARLEVAIASCKVLVVFLSHAAVDSRWVAKEVRYALAKHKLVLPVFLDAVELTGGLGLELAGVHGILLFGASEPAGVDQLARSLYTVTASRREPETSHRADMMNP